MDTQTGLVFPTTPQPSHSRNAYGSRSRQARGGLLHDPETLLTSSTLENVHPEATEDQKEKTTAVPETNT
jgi:hypothetical protein